MVTNHTEELLRQLTLKFKKSTKVKSKERNMGYGNAYGGKKKKVKKPKSK